MAVDLLPSGLLSSGRYGLTTLDKRRFSADVARPYQSVYARVTGQTLASPVGYQIVGDYTPGLLLVVPSLLYDAAGTQNSNIGLRVYEGRFGAANEWVDNPTTSGVPLWVAPSTTVSLIPWNRKLSLLIVFFRNNTAMSALVLELIVLPYD